MKIDKAFQSAYQYYQAGDLNQARNLYKKILSVKPNNIDALHMLEMICCQLGDFDEAIRYMRKEIELTPSNADVNYKLGTVLQVKGLFLESIKYFRKAITLKPNFPDAYYNLGLALQNTGQPDEAIMNYQKAIQIEPGLVEAYNNLGILLSAKGGLEDAITYFQKGLQMNPNYADIYNNLGLALKDKGDIDEAILNYQKATNLDPYFADAYYNLGNALQSKKELDKAMIFYKIALQINPDLAGVQHNLCNILVEKGQIDEAMTYFQKAVMLNPNLAGPYYNLGNMILDKGQPEEAIQYFKKALQIQPDHVDSHFRLSFSLLLSGNFEQGWKEYEWRWKLKNFFTRDFSQPLWDGSDIKDKIILLYTEQGFGDAIQFVRYVPLVVRQGLRVIMECQRHLISLFQNIEGISQIIARGDQLPAFDIHCPLMSLPLVFGTIIDTIPAEIPYIKVNTTLLQKWKDRLLDDNSKFKVGLVWAGSPTFQLSHLKECPLKKFSPLSHNKDITFYSLQKSKAAEQARNPPDGMNLIDYTDEIQDFSDTAALIENLDLVISVDTAVVHLAGALGKPVWTLLPFAPDWRWMLNREDSPWYPTMRLFRQPSHGDWQSVMERVKEELTKSVTSKTKIL